jgi:hypothetical protein
MDGWREKNGRTQGDDATCIPTLTLLTATENGPVYVKVLLAAVSATGVSSAGGGAGRSENQRPRTSGRHLIVLGWDEASFARDVSADTRLACTMVGNVGEK